MLLYTFFFNDPATTEIYTLSLHDALPIYEIVPPAQAEQMVAALRAKGIPFAYVPFEGEQHGFRKAESIRRALEAELYFYGTRSEEHTSELQSRLHLVCRLLLEKKKITRYH